MSKGTQLWPGDKMRSFFSAHIRRETSLDDAAAERLAEALTKAVNRMLVWETPGDVQNTEKAVPAPKSAARVESAWTLKPRMSLKSVRPLLPPKPMSLRKKASSRA